MGSRAAIFSFMPILTKILPESITNIERGRYYRNRFHEISEKWIREHRQDYRGNRTGDLQDAYLVKVNAGEETFTEQGLAAILRELFVIGSESESVMMRWAVRIIACYPDVQEKVRAELEAACGRGVEIVWDKRTQQLLPLLPRLLLLLLPRRRARRKMTTWASASSTKLCRPCDDCRKQCQLPVQYLLLLF